MFGYLDVEKGKLEDGQLGLWQSFMCGLCFSTKQQIGDFPRAFISNDINFFSVLFHSVTNTDVQVDKKRCFSHPIRKRTVLKVTDLSDKLAVANALLTYWKLYDDTVDSHSVKKKTALKLFRKAYKRAKDAFPQLDDMLSARCAELRAMEQFNCDSIDKVAHAFAQLSEDFSVLILGDYSNQYTQNLCYNLGKWVYLIDALDDAPKDIKHHNYNPFVSAYNAHTMADLVGKYDELQFEMYAVLNRVAQCYNDLNLTKYTCILDNILFDSIRNKTKTILQKYK